MSDDVAQHREAAGAALEAGDSGAANAAYAAELAALAGAAEVEPGDDDDTVVDTDADTELPDEDLPAGPMPVAHTDAVLREFRAAFDDQQADELQRAWGDHAVEHSALAGALAADAKLAPIFEQHQDEAGALTAPGVQGAYAALQAAGVPPEVFKDVELQTLFLEHFDEDTAALSPAGARILLARVAKLSGYKFNRRTSPRTTTSTTTTKKEPAMSTIEAELSKGDDLRKVRDAIAEAQARGDSARANDLYRLEQRLIAKGGNAPIVNGRRTA